MSSSSSSRVIESLVTLGAITNLLTRRGSWFPLVLVGCFNVGDLLGKSPPRSNPSPSPNPDPNSNPNPNPNPKPNAKQARAYQHACA